MMSDHIRTPWFVRWAGRRKPSPLCIFRCVAIFFFYLFVVGT